jgi:hypothetical protein
VERIAAEAVAWLVHPWYPGSNACKLEAELVWRGSVRGG